MERRMRPTLRYHGGKWMLAPWIIENLPEHRAYVEPFGGAASVLLRKPRSYAEVYNDLDDEVVNVFRVLRHHGRKLKKQLELTPFSRTEFFDAYGPIDEPIERARRTIVKAFQGFGSDAIKTNTGFRSNAHRSGTTPALDWAHYADALPFLIERLRGVVIENRDAIKIIQQHDRPDTLFYVDPPYVHETRQSAHRYKFEMDEKQHRALAKVLKKVKGKVVLSGYASVLYHELYRTWGFKARPSLADGAKPRMEYLWFNF